MNIIGFLIFMLLTVLFFRSGMSSQRDINRENYTVGSAVITDKLRRSSENVYYKVLITGDTESFEAETETYRWTQDMPRIGDIVTLRFWPTKSRKYRADIQDDRLVNINDKST